MTRNGFVIVCYSLVGSVLDIKMRSSGRIIRPCTGEELFEELKLFSETAMYYLSVELKKVQKLHLLLSCNKLASVDVDKISTKQFTVHFVFNKNVVCKCWLDIDSAHNMSISRIIALDYVGRQLNGFAE